MFINTKMDAVIIRVAANKNEKIVWSISLCYNIIMISRINSDRIRLILGWGSVYIIYN